ncbi:hypothetical protein HAX54_005061, partial [Datura stramonium]|nr:hypothetical protein [Datura stramonium]
NIGATRRATWTYEFHSAWREAPDSQCYSRREVPFTPALCPAWRTKALRPSSTRPGARAGNIAAAKGATCIHVGASRRARRGSFGASRRATHSSSGAFSAAMRSRCTSRKI